MPERIPDDLLAKHLRQIGAATLEQIEAARKAAAEAAQRGAELTLADELVRRGVLTEALRENVERKLAAQMQGGIRKLGQYKLLSKLGEGGMGAVYLAEDALAERKVALKILPQKYALDAEFLSRFQREAVAAGKLNHPNIVAAYAFANDLGLYYYVMEYVEGETLDRMLDRGETLPFDRALGIVMQAARGLEHAHRHGILHRDIKPDNVIVAGDGTAKILDLGLSKNLDVGAQSSHTVAGIALGTPDYMSPEQARGDRDVDRRTDIYSLGATFFHLVTGRTPYEGETAADVMKKHLFEPPPDPRKVREAVPETGARIIRKMMAKAPGDRYQDCAQLIADLERVAAGEEPAVAAPKAAKQAPGAAGMRRGGTGKADPVRAARAAASDPDLVRETRKNAPVSGIPSGPALQTAALGIGAAVVLAFVVLYVLVTRQPSDAPGPEKRTPDRPASPATPPGKTDSKADPAPVPVQRKSADPAAEAGWTDLLDPPLSKNWKDDPVGGTPSAFRVEDGDLVLAGRSRISTQREDMAAFAMQGEIWLDRTTDSRAEVITLNGQLVFETDKAGRWIPFRVAVKDGRMDASVDGQPYEIANPGGESKATMIRLFGKGEGLRKFRKLRLKVSSVGTVPKPEPEGEGE